METLMSAGLVAIHIGAEDAVDLEYFVRSAAASEYGSKARSHGSASGSASDGSGAFEVGSSHQKIIAAITGSMPPPPQQLQ
jgi:hypothetical protein